MSQPPNTKRNDAFHHAKCYARSGKFLMARAWLERAESFGPLTTLQVWTIKNIVGWEKFRELATDRMKEELVQ